MPMGSVLLKPGVNIEKTPSLNEAGVSESQLIRYKDGLIQSYGGWETFNSIAVPSTVRDLHAWMDVAGDNWLAAGATSNLMVLTATSNTDVTPQTRTTNPPPDFSISSGSFTVIVVDANSGPSVYTTVFFDTPISIGNILLEGAYKITSVLSTGSYSITSSVEASTTISNAGTLPVFDTTNGSAIVTVTLPNNGITGDFDQRVSFYAPTSVGGLTIEGPYTVNSIIDSTSYTIATPTISSATATATMNSSLAELVYYISIGPQVTGSGFGAGGFGSGGFGTGTTFIGDPGSPITASDWTLDNWGEILLACPENGPIYTWSPASGLQNADVIESAPFFNGGIFVSMPQQILVAWRSTQSTGTQDNLVIRWSDAGDFTNWDITNATAAGRFHIPTGSILMGGLQAPNFGVLWTDIDAWIMQYVGGDVIFNFTRVGSGCGLIGKHAANVIANEVYWCGISNFFKLGAGGVTVIPCTVWDFIFQNLNTAHANKILCAPNSAFNEIAWFFPSTGATENDSYVKYNIIEHEWDYGVLDRTAWVDVSVLGNPIGSDHQGFIYQHETGDTITGAGVPTFKSGWWALTEGNDLAFVDYVIPDFKWSIYSGDENAQLQITFLVVNYPGETPTSYGPYTVTKATEYITPRLRGRLMAISVTGANDVFWRLGRIRFRYAISGRR